MIRIRRRLVGTIAAGILLATAVAAVAETCTLTLKRRETKSARFDSTSYMYWSVRPQYFYVQMSTAGDERSGPAVSRDPSQAEAFQRIVKKEPKYQSKNPFRGVIKLGSQEYAFALDVAAPVPDAKGTAAPAIAKGTAAPAAKPEGSTKTEKPPAKRAPLKDLSYNRLYFDFNHNGDLTDDKVVEAPADDRRSVALTGPGVSYSRFEFPRIDVTLDVEGSKLDYSFLLDGYAYASSRACNVMVSVTAAICREGDITLEGKRHHLVVLDYNSNGRFDDVSKISQDTRMASGQLYPETGDMLLIDPKRGAFESPYDPTASDYRYYVSPVVPIDGRWYDLKISPAGDYKLTLTRSTVPLGSVTNRNETFRALIYGDDKGFLQIRGSKGTPISLPVGEWKLFSYTITHAEPVKPTGKAAAKTGEKETAGKAAKAKDGSVLGSLGQFLAATASETARMGPSFVSATATDKYKAVTVRQGETVELPFGPPYTPTVTAMSGPAPNGQARQVSLEMSLIGAGGEACTNLMVKGGRPGKPEFTITDPDGKVVEQGSFEYG